MFQEEVLDQHLITFVNLNKSNSFTINRKYIRGIDKQMYNLYKPNKDGMFKCLTTNQLIEFYKLNDDYCDCTDGSDEPSTSACQFGTFYCSFQNQLLPNYNIPSSRVDDKICDCCDGSDENSKINCKNTCDSLISKIKKKIKDRSNAEIEKQKYIKEGMNKDENLYGPKGIFYRLKQECLEISASKYLYKVCPYREITQGQSNKVINIGRVSNLTKKDSNNWILEMKNGDNDCGRARSSQINLVCGAKNELISVQEPEKCFYVFHLNTPAAC
ncbi:unnamed protein product [Brachionus calyciflorus]|uniref:MRH domain-containing protein n=1 Tax=Brachionus calyciflorus TaxID=104777 RepID=A0A814EB23_9BILA|nr:unnamed protein product [Brachionus calyciflorus]